jgi:hypothetical protein
MAELLILAFDTFGPNDEADRHAWKLGHVVDIKPDGHVWGSKECLPKLYKVKIPGVSVAQVQKFLEQKIDLTNPDAPVITGIRKWKLNLNDVPVSARNELMSTGEITVNKQNIFEAYMNLV